MKRRILAGIISVVLVGGGVYLLNSEDSFKGKQTPSESSAKFNFNFFNNKGLSLKNWLTALHIIKEEKPSAPINSNIAQKQDVVVQNNLPSTGTTGSIVKSSNNSAVSAATISTSSGIASGMSSTTTTDTIQSTNVTYTNSHNTTPTPIPTSSPSQVGTPQNPITPPPLSSSTGKGTPTSSATHGSKSTTPTLVGMNKEIGPVQGVSPLLYKGLHLQLPGIKVNLNIKG